MAGTSMKTYTIPNNGRIAGQECTRLGLPIDPTPKVYRNRVEIQGVSFLIFGFRWDLEVWEGDIIEWDDGIALVFIPYKTILDEENLVRL